MVDGDIESSMTSQRKALIDKVRMGSVDDDGDVDDDDDDLLDVDLDGMLGFNKVVGIKGDRAGV